jgi:ribosomal protein L40E
VHGHLVVDGCVWGRHLIHLICLRCNRANAPEAKFCSECGAGLLRKFCSRCRAINDAESHFCQSCGEALPVQPSVPHAAPTRPPAIVPDLTDVYDEPDEPATALHASAPDSRWRHEAQSDEPVRDEPVSDEPVENAPVQDAPVSDRPMVISQPPRIAPMAVAASHRTVLFGFVGGAALLLAALLWSHSEQPSSSAEVPGPAAPSVAAATGPATIDAAPAQPAPAAAASDTAMRSGTSAGAGASVPAPAKEAGKPQERRLAPEAQIAAQPPAAGPAPRAAVERRPIVRSAQPPTPPADCTPQVDALGLCAPGANVADRSGSR